MFSKKYISGKIREPSAFLIHTTVKYSLANWDKTDEEIQNDILNHFKCLIPELPEPSYIKCVKWAYSQV